GFVYRGKKRPELAGAYIYGDYGSGRIWSLRAANGSVTEDRLLTRADKAITSFGEDESGELYVVTYEGRLWQLAPKAKSGS
ncbi:MAG: glucose sorbosone dehydrogenase, partial [Candidatus Wallbacteria bacterium]|nr:glucose sorbosone dehydrogenase [Candidatus Wallbacteria bacterium]